MVFVLEIPIKATLHVRLYQYMIYPLRLTWIELWATGHGLVFGIYTVVTAD